MAVNLFWPQCIKHLIIALYDKTLLCLSYKPVYYCDGEQQHCSILQ